jgi:penicillin-binding protein 2
LQIANLGATIANRGHYVTPHIVKEINGESLHDSLLVEHRTMVDRKWYDNIVRGMRQAVTGGTCRGANSALYEVCGKTGTAQNKGRDHSAFMGFAPMNDPKIAIAVYVENGGFGATYGVPIGALMMEQYLTDSLSEASLARANEIQKRVIVDTSTDYIWDLDI